MDWLTFIAEMFKAAAWPAAAVAIALMFRTQLRALLARVSKGRFGPAEFEFEQALQVLAAQSAAPAGTRSPATASGVTRAALPAREAIAAAWHELKQAAQTRVQTVPRMPPLEAQDMALYQKLEALQEKAQGNGDFHPSAQAVTDYVQLARGLQARMKGTPPG